MRSSKAKTRKINAINATEADASGERAKSRRSNDAHKAAANGGARRLYGVHRSDKLGFVLIQGCLVPFSFLDFLQQRCAGNFFIYGRVLSPREMIGEDGWSQIEDSEKEIVGACMAHLIESDAVKVRALQLADDHR